MHNNSVFQHLLSQGGEWGLQLEIAWLRFGTVKHAVLALAA